MNRSKINSLKKLLIASNNAHKAEEIKEMLSPLGAEVFTLKDKNIDIDVIEDADTLEGNALKKAKEIYKVAKMPVISDDTGLFVKALRGKPGVYSARYAGENATYKDNCEKIISELKSFGMEYSPAYFMAVICLYIDDDVHYFFEGTSNGQIITEMRGDEGFGYDPLFIPKGHIRTFAELKPEEKNKVSHRGRALDELKEFIQSY